MSSFQILLDPQVLAAWFSALATLFAAYAALRGPISAAEAAELMREKSERASEQRRQKLNVFTTLMQERAAYYSLEAVKSFNLIDVVFNESRSVRDSWSEFMESVVSKTPIVDVSLVDQLSVPHPDNSFMVTMPVTGDPLFSK